MLARVHLLVLFYCFSLFSFSNATHAQANYETQLESIDALVEKTLITFDVPGVAIGVVVDGKIIYTKGFGYCDRISKQPVTDHTLFPILSCTKAFTAFIIGELVDEHILHWDDPVVNYLPSFRLGDEQRTNKITIRDLLAHRSGLARHDILWYNSNPGRNDTETASMNFLNRLQYLEPTCPLQEKYIYNNWMYYVAGLIAEKVTATPWEKLLKNRIFSRLGMDQTDCLSEHSYQITTFARPHGERNGNHVSIPFFDFSLIRAAGAIYSNVHDMAKWLQLQLFEGNFQGKEYLRKDTFREMHTLQISHSPLINGPETSFGYGLGWHIGKYREHMLVDHAGAFDGFYTNVALLPEKNIGIVVLGNSSYFGKYFPSAITNAIFDLFLEYNDFDWITNNFNLCKSIIIEMQKRKKENEAQKNSEVDISYPLIDYVAEYKHPGYGTIRIYLDDQQLYAHYYRLTMPLISLGNDLFEVSEKAENPVLSGASISFSRDEKGIIQTLAIPMEPTLKPLIFHRIQ